MYFRTLQKNKDVVLFLLRLVVGCIFLSHGYMKFMNFESAPTLMQVLAIVEPLAGIAMIVGVLARWAGVVLGVIMIGAMYMKISGMGLVGFSAQGGWELDALIFVSCLLIMMTGGGKYSMDVHAGWDKA